MRAMHYPKRLFSSVQRVLSVIRKPEDILQLLILYVRFCIVTFALFIRRKPLAECLHGPLPDHDLSWPHFRSRMRALVPFVPVGRNHRCLLMSVVGFRFLQGRKEPCATMELLATKKGERVVFHARLLDQQDRILLDTDEGGAYKALGRLDTKTLDKNELAKSLV